MKKIILLLAACIFMITGCQKNGNSDSTENTAGDSRESGYPSSQSSPSSPTYYKLEVTPTVYDVDSVLNYLMPGYDKSRVQKEGDDYSIEIDGIKHNWRFGKNYFTYYSKDSTPEGALTEEEALAYSDDFVEQFGYDVAENPEIWKNEDGNYIIRYTFQYEGVPILGNDGGIDLKNGDEEDGFAHGEFVEISVNGNGIRNLSLDHLYDPAAVLEEYRQEEFISRDQLDSIIKAAMNSVRQSMTEWSKREGKEFDTRIEEIELIYIPWQEKGKWVLLPAFSVRWVPLMDGVAGGAGEPDPMLIDAVSGYVYRL